MLSVLAIPGLLSAPSPASPHSLAQQWAGLYHRGKVLGPQAAALSLLGYGYLAYAYSSNSSSKEPQRSSRSAWFVGAAALGLAIVPFTVLVMDPTNQALLGVAGAHGAGQKVEEAAVRALLERWARLNLARSILPLVGATLGLWGLVG